MNNQILSLNISNLKTFIKSQNFTDNKLIISFKYIIPNIIYIKILQSLDKKYSYKFESESSIIFENESNKIICKFEDEKKLRALGDLVNTQITTDIIENIDNVKIIKYKKLLSINDKLFLINIYKKYNEKIEDDNISPIYEYNQVIHFNNVIKLISQNNSNFYFEYIFDYNTDESIVTENINYIINLISFKKIRLIENDLYIDNYRTITKNNDNTIRTNNPINISIEDLLDKIDMSHCVFSKTDGERVHILIYDKIVCHFDSILNTYYITTIQNTSINILYDAELYDNTYYIFNVLYDNSVENINDYSLQYKLELANNFIKNNNLKNFIVKTPSDFTDKTEKFYSDIVDLININKNSEIKSDGIIFQSILSTNKTNEKKIKDYKWKPLDETSLDFFVQINNILIRSDEGSFFKLNLYGYTINENHNEILKLFSTTNIKVNEDINTIDHTYPITLNNEIITNNMVVEFNPDFDDNGNIVWIPYRVRYDKSLASFYYKKKHGNHIDVCNKTVDYINNPITENDLYLLATNYENGYKILADKIKNKKIFTKRDPIIDRLFDFVKTNVITTFARWNVILENIKTVNMIDLSCGNGSDLLKLYEYGVLVKKNNFIYNGFNDNRIQIESTFNGAISRYKKFTSDKTYSNFPLCSFFIYDINQILEKVNNKYNHLICYDMYKYQNSKKNIYTISKIINKVMLNNSYLFICLASENLNYENLNYTINVSIDEVLNIFNTCKVIERLSFNLHVQNLLKYKQYINNMTNIKTKEFLQKTIIAYDKLSYNILNQIEFIILTKIK
jgi:hypothetical protein